MTDENEKVENASNDNDGKVKKSSLDVLDSPVGNQEKPKLNPKRVKIVDVEVKSPKEGSKAKIVICHCEHHEAKQFLGKETIEISQVKMENVKNHKLEVLGLWINLDSENKLQKGSTTANFLNFVGVSTIRDLKGKEVNTIARENDFLAFKGY